MLVLVRVVNLFFTLFQLIMDNMIRKMSFLPLIGTFLTNACLEAESVYLKKSV